MNDPERPLLPATLAEFEILEYFVQNEDLTQGASLFHVKLPSSGSDCRLLFHASIDVLNSILPRHNDRPPQGGVRRDDWLQLDDYFKDWFRIVASRKRDPGKDTSRLSRHLERRREALLFRLRSTEASGTQNVAGNVNEQTTSFGRLPDVDVPLKTGRNAANANFNDQAAAFASMFPSLQGKHAPPQEAVHGHFPFPLQAFNGPHFRNPAPFLAGTQLSSFPSPQSGHGTPGGLPRIHRPSSSLAAEIPPDPLSPTRPVPGISQSTISNTAQSGSHKRKRPHESSTTTPVASAQRQLETAQPAHKRAKVSTPIPRPSLNLAGPSSMPSSSTLNPGSMQAHLEALEKIYTSGQSPSIDVDGLELIVDPTTVNLMSQGAAAMHRQNAAKPNGFPPQANQRFMGFSSNLNAGFFPIPSGSATIQNAGFPYGQGSSMGTPRRPDQATMQQALSDFAAGLTQDPELYNRWMMHQPQNLGEAEASRILVAEEGNNTQGQALLSARGLTQALPASEDEGNLPAIYNLATALAIEAALCPAPVPASPQNPDLGASQAPTVDPPSPSSLSDLFSARSDSPEPQSLVQLPQIERPQSATQVPSPGPASEPSHPQSDNGEGDAENQPQPQDFMDKISAGHLSRSWKQVVEEYNHTLSSVLESLKVGKLEDIVSDLNQDPTNSNDKESFISKAIVLASYMYDNAEWCRSESPWTVMLRLAREEQAWREWIAHGKSLVKEG